MIVSGSMATYISLHKDFIAIRLATLESTRQTYSPSPSRVQTRYLNHSNMNTLDLGDINVKVDTDVSEKKFSFRWTVQNISKIPSSVRSMKFSLAGHENKDWFATVTTLPNEHFRVSLTCISEKPIPLRIEHVTRAFGSNSRSLAGGISNCLLFFERPGQEGVLVDEVECPHDHGKAVIQCCMKIYGYDLNTTCELLDAHDAPDMDLVEYQHGFRTMMNDESLADLKINTAGRSFSVHKCVLKFRAPGFFKLHEKDIAEGEFVINGIDSNIFGRFLEYVYIGEEGQLLAREDYRKLYRVAHRYALEGLKRRCAKAICEDLTVDSVVDVFLLAHKHEDELFLLQCKVFMRKNLEELATRVKWNNLLKCNLNVLEDVMKLHD